jgi:hypothetical protein
MTPQQDATTEQLTADQLEMLPKLVEGAEPDAYVVVPVAVLSRQIDISVRTVTRRYRGELRPGPFAVHLMLSLQRVGVLVDTKHQGNGMDRVNQ